MATHSVFLSGKSHGQSSLGGYSPWGCTKEHHHSYSKEFLAMEGRVLGEEQNAQARLTGILF